jgi:NADH:ubiquinone oxidoreductase subunit 3 (subunit A)
MGAAFSTNSLNDLTNETNDSVTQNAQSIINRDVGSCSNYTITGVTIGCVDKNGNLVGVTGSSGPTTFAGKVILNNTNQQICKFDNQQTSNLTSTNVNKLSNASQKTITQLNNLMQEAGSFSFASATNQQNIADNLFNNMYINNVQDITNECVQSLVNVEKSNIVICNADFESTGEIIINNNYQGQLIGSCIAKSLFNTNNNSSAINSVIQHITQTNDITQKGILGSLIAFAILVVLLFGSGIVSANKNVQQSNVKYVLYAFIFIVILGIGAAVAIGLYYAFRPPDQSITPIEIDSKNNLVCLKFVSNDPAFPIPRPNSGDDPNQPTNVDYYTVAIPAGTYGDGDTLAMAIETAVNSKMYSSGASMKAFLAGLTSSTIDKTATQQLRANFDPEAKTISFTTTGGSGQNNPELGFNLIFTNCPGSIFNVVKVDPSFFGTTFTYTNQATTLPLPYTKPLNLWFYFAVVFGGLGIIFLIIGGILLARWLINRNKKSTVDKNDVEMTEMTSKRGKQ